MFYKAENNTFLTILIFNPHKYFHIDKINTKELIPASNKSLWYRHSEQIMMKYHYYIILVANGAGYKAMQLSFSCRYALGMASLLLSQKLK